LWPGDLGKRYTAEFSFTFRRHQLVAMAVVQGAEIFERTPLFSFRSSTGMGESAMRNLA
jgi:hypothetical protein